MRLLDRGRAASTVSSGVKVEGGLSIFMILSRSDPIAACQDAGSIRAWGQETSSTSRRLVDPNRNTFLSSCSEIAGVVPKDKYLRYSCFLKAIPSDMIRTGCDECCVCEVGVALFGG